MQTDSALDLGLSVGHINGHEICVHSYGVMSKDQPSGNVDAVFNQIPTQGINLGTPREQPSSIRQNRVA